jgi:hypothetical protein
MGPFYHNQALAVMKGLEAGGKTIAVMTFGGLKRYVLDRSPDRIARNSQKEVRLA